MTEIVLEAQKKLSKLLKKDANQLNQEKQQEELKKMQTAPLSELHQTQITQGKYKGKTFQEVVHLDQPYLKWLSEREKLMGHSLQMLMIYAARMVEIPEKKVKASGSEKKDKTMEVWEEIGDESFIPVTGENQVELMELMENQATMNQRTSRLENVLEQVITMLQAQTQPPPEEP